MDRDISLIHHQVKLVRTAQASMDDWTDQELLDDIEVILGELLFNIQKYRKRTNKAASKRLRAYLLDLETLGKEFRKKSVK